MYCKNCGTYVSNGAYCPNCGAPINNSNSNNFQNAPRGNYSQGNSYQNYYVQQVQPNKSATLGVIAFILTILGFSSGNWNKYTHTICLK